MDSTIPESVSPETLLQNAVEAEQLVNDLAAAEVQWENNFYREYLTMPGGLDHQTRMIQAEVACRESYPDLFQQIEAARTRINGFKLKAGLANSAYRALGVPTIEHSL